MPTDRLQRVLPLSRALFTGVMALPGLLIGIACLTPAGIVALLAVPVWTLATSIAAYRAQRPGRQRAHRPAVHAG